MIHVEQPHFSFWCTENVYFSSFTPPLKGPEQQVKFGGGGGAQILGQGGAMNPNDAMVVLLKDILLCLFGFRFIYIVYIS